MKDITKQKKHKHHRTYSDSSSGLNDEDNEKFYKKKSNKYDTDVHDHEFEDAKHQHHHHHHHHHRKHSRKHKRSQSVDSDSHIEVSKEKKSKHHDDFPVVKIKQEPVSDIEDYSSRKTRSRNDTDIRLMGDSQGTGDRENSNRRDLSDGRKRQIKLEQESGGGDEQQWGRRDMKLEGDQRNPQVNKAKPDFGLSGKLAEDTNTFNGIVIKYSEPPEARKPKRRWRLYPFKGDVGLPTLYIHRQSAYLIGRDRKVADIPVDHPSCSKQHAALQYRLVPYTKEDGTNGKRVRPYIIDLESANGSFVNNVKIEPKKYVELLEKDVIKFAYSSREYVILHEHSKDSDQDDDDM